MCTRTPALAAELFRRGLRDHRRALLAWCAGILAYVGLIVAIFPSIESSPEFDELLEAYPDLLKELIGIGEGGSLTSGAGFLDAELFSLMLPIFVLFLGIGSGARTFAGEEDAGRLEVLLSYPLRRRDAVIAKAAAVACEVLVVSAVAGLALLASDAPFGLDLETDRIVAATAWLSALGLFHGWLALAVGAATGSRGLALGVPAGLAAAGFLVSGLHGVAGWLDPFRFLSTFWLVGSSPLQGGAEPLGLLVIVAVGLAAVAAGAVLVERRDLETP